MAADRVPDAEGRAFRRSVASTFATTVGVAVLSLVNVVVLARALGPEGRGSVVYAMTVGTITAMLASVSVQEALANAASARPERRGALGAAAVLLALVLGTAGALLLAGVTALVPAVTGGLATAVLVPVLVALPVLVFYQYGLLFLRACSAHGAANAATIAVPACILVVNGAMAIAGVLTVRSAVLVWIGTIAVASVAMLARLHAAHRLARPSGSDVGGLLRFGAQTHPNGIMALTNYRVDQWLIGAIAGPRELGLYSVAVAAAEVLFFLPTTLALVSRPRLVTAGREAAARHAASSLRLALLVTLPAAVVLVAIATPLIVTLFGAEFTASADLLRILVPGAFGIAAIKVLGNALVARGRPLLELVAVAAAFVVTVAGAIVLMPELGADGAAITSTLSYTAAGIVIVVIFARFTGTPARQFVPRRGDLALGRDLAAGVLRPLVARVRRAGAGEDA